MSEEKLYAVKNAKGLYLSLNANGDWVGTPQFLLQPCYLRVSTNVVEMTRIASLCGGRVVTFVEEPKKVVLTKEQAKIVEEARDQKFPADYISGNSGLGAGGEEELLMNAYVNGYTVAKEKKYLVYKELGGKQKTKQVAQAYRSSVYSGTVSWIINNEVTNKSFAQFIESEIEQYGLQDCEKKEVTDDGIR